MSDERQKHTEEEPAFKVRDRRSFHADGSPRTEEGTPSEGGSQTKAASTEARAEKAGAQRPRQPLPAIDFGTFIISLSTSALVHLGEVADPATGETIPPNLPLAKQTIDILGILQEKTRGNLTPEEANLLQNLLSDLRLRYVNKLR